MSGSEITIAQAIERIHPGRQWHNVPSDHRREYTKKTSKAWRDRGNNTPTVYRYRSKFPPVGAKKWTVEELDLLLTTLTQPEIALITGRSLMSVNTKIRYVRECLTGERSPRFDIMKNWIKDNGLTLKNFRTVRKWGEKPKSWRLDGE